MNLPFKEIFADNVIILNSYFISIMLNSNKYFRAIVYFNYTCALHFSLGVTLIRI